MALDQLPLTANNGLRAREGRVNGSLGASRGRINGSQVHAHRGYTNGRGSNPAVRMGGGPRQRPARQLASAALVGAVVLPALMILAVPERLPHFAADGDFREWASVTPVADSDANPVPAFADLTEVRTAYDSSALFVYARAAAPWFSGREESVVRIFVDADGNRSTGFNLGDIGADVMLEAAGSLGAVQADGLFTFAPGRSTDDWHGWHGIGSPALAVSGGELEAGFGAGALSTASAVVAVSTPTSEDLLETPAAVHGSLVVRQSLPPQAVLNAGDRAVPMLRLVLSANVAPHAVSAVTFGASGSSNFSQVEAARLVFDGGSLFEASGISAAQVAFVFPAPLPVVLGVPVRATLEFDLKGGRGFSGHGGDSFGATVQEVFTTAKDTLVVVQPRELPPAAYLGFVSPLPVIDGAFGEWRLASAAPDPIDAGAAAGSDLVGVRAMGSGNAGAFFAEARGTILTGAGVGDLPTLVEFPKPSPGVVAPAAPAPPEPQPELPPLSTDDRVLAYLDTDSNPLTGFRPADDIPIGAEYVIQVSGRFSASPTAQLLRFAGSWSQDSTWEPVRVLKSAAFGPALEAEIPAEVFSPNGGARLLIQTVDWTGRTADLSDVLQDVAVAPTDPDHELHFRSVTFDPLNGPPPVRPQMLFDTPNAYWVVQLASAPGGESIGALEAAGATLFGYVHSNAYLARMDNGTAATVRSLPGVRWVGTYEPAFKFADDPSSWPAGPVNVVALLFERPRGLEGEVEQAGGQVLSATDLAVRVRINGSQAAALGFVPEVQFIEPENQRVPLNDVGRRLLGVNLTFERYAYNGSGIVVGISDSGVDYTHPAFDDTGTNVSGPHFDGRIVGYFKYAGSYGDTDGHGTHTAGTVLGDGDLSSTVNNSIAGGAVQFRGMAPGARLVETVIFNGGAPADDAVFADQQAYAATVSSNSWGYVDGTNHGITDYDSAAYLTDQSVIDSNTSRAGLQPMTIVFAAGNDGSGADTAGSPGTAKNVITVGASETDRGYDTYSDNSSSIATFSSRGPTDDGRVKPDIVAVGTYVLSTQSRTSGCTCTYGGWDMSWTGPNYAFSSGTSMATPMVAGIAALFQQHINQTFGRIPSPALVKAALINGAEDLGYGYEYTTGVTGPMSQGWGRVNVTRSVEGPPDGRILFFEEGAVVSSGDVVVRRFTVSNASTPLKVTAVWTDQPGNPVDTKTLPELVNDLDLVVRAPNGTFYHGNKFQGAWSRANNSSFDRVNNVENVFVQTPTAGTWTVEVSGFSLKSAEQRFAMAVSGNLTEKAPPSVADAHDLPGAPASAKFGWNATAAGSINGDSYRDLIVGAPGTGGGNGSVYIFFGGAGKSLASLSVSAADVTLSGAAAEGFGSSVDASGDFDGDGKNDLLVGAPGGGRAYLYLGGSSWVSRAPDLTLNGSAASLFGAAVRLAAIDNRTGAEAIVGAPLDSNSTGAAYIFSGGGASGTWNASGANATLTGPANGSRFGTALAAGDVDGDGALDLAVGSPGASVVKVVRGGVAASALGFAANFSGIPGTAFGQSVALGGDVNGDGKADLLVGAPLANDSAGASYLFLGRSPLTDDRVLRYYFFDDMESGVSLWDEMNGSTVTASPWSLSSAAYFGPASAGHSWQDSAGNYASRADASIATKSGVNLSAAANPVLSFVYRADLEGQASTNDGFTVLYSLNGGSTWTQLDSTNAQGLYDAPGTNPAGTASDSAISGLFAFTYDRFVWRSVAFNVSSLAGNSSVKFRFQFASSPSGNADGVYLDDIAVREARPSSPNYTVYGNAAGDLLGWSVAAMGDLNGDGYGDFAVGAPQAPSGLTAGAGAAFVFAGSPSLNGSVSALSAAEVLQGPSPSANLAWSLAPVTGFNNSSATYLFAGAPGLNSGAGGALIGHATAPIPEFADLSAAVAMAAAVALVGRARRRR